MPGSARRGGSSPTSSPSLPSGGRSSSAPWPGCKRNWGLEDQKLESSLYELLLYEKGGFFLPHRDGEKAGRMVATLVFVLPSTFEGGELAVRHEGQEKVIDHAPDASRLIQHAAFYADCEHELRPLRQGHRLCLVYNLCLAKSKKRILAPSSAGAIEQAARVLSSWAAREDAGKLVVPLGHQYTEAGVAWDTLKGTDRPKAQVLREAAKRAGCRSYLALLTFHESGEAEYAPRSESGGRRRRHWDEDSEDAADYRMGEVYDSELEATHWQDPEGGAFPLESVGIAVEEIVGGEDALTAIDPDVVFEGFTGNEGMTLDRWYRHAAIVLWPEARHYEKIAQAGCRRAAQVLAGQAERWQAEGKPEAGRGELRQFAEAVARNWKPKRDRRDKDDLEPFLFKALAGLGDPGLIRAYLSQVLPQDPYSDPGTLLVAACEPHGWAAFQAELRSLVAGTTVATLERNARLVQTLCLAKPKKDKALPALREALAARLAAALVEIDQQKPEGWEQDRIAERIDRAALLASMARSLDATGQQETLAQVVAHAFGLPKKYPLAQAHVAGLERLRPWLAGHPERIGAGMAAWLDGCESRLEALTADKPQPPADQRRSAEVSGTSPECLELARFLADPVAKEHRFRAIQSVRTDIEHQVRRDRLDLDMRTDKQGSPHTLVCTKNTATYQAALKKYEENVRRLADVRSLRS